MSKELYPIQSNLNNDPYIHLNPMTQISIFTNKSIYCVAICLFIYTQTIYIDVLQI